MSPLTLPGQGSVYLDSSAFIYFVEGVEPYHSLLAPVWQSARAGRFTLVSSEVLIAETLIKVVRENDRMKERLFRSAMSLDFMELQPAVRSLWEDAVEIGGPARLTSLDALHAATALSAASAMFITSDDDFRRVPGLPVVILRECV